MTDFDEIMKKKNWNKDVMVENKISKIRFN